MSSRLCALVLVLILGACGGSKSPPSNLDNACSIVNQRPNYLRAMKKSERKWGVPVAVQMAVIHQESKFDGNARTPHQYVLGIIPMGRQSSAYGYAQAIDSTWDNYRSSTNRRGAKRTNINDATDFIGWYMNQTYKKAGVSKRNARDQYLAYHEGQAGYLKGTHYGKPWLLGVADGVGTRAIIYDRQLKSCRKI